MEKKKVSFKKVNVNLIDRPTDVARLDIDKSEIEELARSINTQGLLQPIVINKTGNRFEVVAGDRRLMAVKSLHQTTVMARVVEIGKKEVALARAAENLQRQNLTPIEEALQYDGMYKKLKMSVDDIAKKIGKSAGVIKRRMDLLRMPDSFKSALHSKKIGIAVAEELWSCSDNGHREYLLEMAVEHGVTTNVARMWVLDFNKLQRQKLSGEGEGGGIGSVMENDPIYRSCDLCKEPVDLSKVNELRMCDGCFNAIVEILNKGGK